MIPGFTESGMLPPGIHLATWDEFVARFAVFRHSDQRLRIGQQLQSLYDEVRRLGIVRRFLIVGSYVTDKAEPNDYDCLIVIDPAIMNTRLPPISIQLDFATNSSTDFQG